eukprot:1069713-Pleurochrysis_carterae.AAC.7
MHGARFSDNGVKAQRSAGGVEREGNLAAVLHEERTERGVRNRRLVRLGAWLIGASLLFRSGLVALGAALRAVFVPVVPLAPPARRPLAAPLLVCFRSRALRIGRFAAGVLAVVILSAIVFATHRESVRGAGIGLEFTSHVANFSVTQYATCGCDGESKVADACVEQ